MHHMVGEVKGERSALKDKISVSSGDDVEDDEDGYFTGYAHFSIHHDMLAVLAQWSRYSSRTESC